MTTNLTASTATGHASGHEAGTITYGEPFIYAEGAHNGRSIVVWKQTRVQEWPADKWNAEPRVYTGERSEVLVDGARYCDAPAGTPAQVLRKIAAKLDEAAADDAMRAELVKLVSNDDTGAERLTEAPAIGAVVYVYAMGRMRRGQVVKVTATRATVAYTTASSAGRIFRKADTFAKLTANLTAHQAEAPVEPAPADVEVVEVVEPAAEAGVEFRKVGRDLYEIVRAGRAAGRVAYRAACWWGYDLTGTLRTAGCSTAAEAAAGVEAAAQAATCARCPNVGEHQRGAVWFCAPCWRLVRAERAPVERVAGPLQLAVFPVPELAGQLDLLDA